MNITDVGLLISKHPSNWSTVETKSFLLYKEAQYSRRRDRVQNYCNLQDERFSRKVYTLIYDDIDRVSYCPIAKVASSSWCDHFVRLGEAKLNIKLGEKQLSTKKITKESFIAANVSERKHNQYRKALQMMAPRLWPAPKEGRNEYELMQDYINSIRLNSNSIS